MAEVTKNICLMLPRLTNKLDNLRENLVDFLNSHKISEGVVSGIELSVYEAVVNIIEHCSPEYIDREIKVECSVTGRKVLITITHFGNAFDVTKVQLPDIEKHYRSGKMRGLGIYFIMTLMDSVDYNHNNMINTLTMVKTF
jgi:serine/threonine-protein kinase RsbW